MKRFVEDDIELSFSSPVRFVQSVACMLLTAPYKLVMSISAKVLYLPKDSILKVLMNSVIISGIITVINIAFQLYVGRFSLLQGKLPVIIMIVATLLLLGCYFAVSMADINVYTQLDDIFPESCSDESKEPVSGDEPASGAEFVSEIEEPANGDGEPVNGSESVSSESKPSNEKPGKHKYTYNPVVTPEVLEKVHTRTGKFTDNDEYNKFVESLASLTDPSKFLSENLLARFANEQVIEDEINLMALNVGIIPNDFKALA